MTKRPGTMPWESPRPKRKKKRAKKKRIDKEYPTTDDGSTSVRAVPSGAFESNRRRH